MVPVCVGFALVQRTGFVSKTTRLMNRIAAGRLEGAIGTSDRIDRAIQVMYRRIPQLIACFFWQLLGWLTGAGEIWLAMRFLGHPLDVADAIAVEALIQAVSSVAFAVPGALGVQEGAFLLIGAALGIDAPTALALATARRIRDVVIFFPGLLAWQFREGGKAARDHSAAVS
jgi:putative membrane protein